MVGVLHKANLFTHTPSIDPPLKRRVCSVSFSMKTLTLCESHSMRISISDDQRRFKSLASPTSKDSFRLENFNKWWEKGQQANMREVDSAQDLVNSLKSAGDRLAILVFFSPGCGGCRALHPKLGKLAGMNPDVDFLLVNYEDHKSMCYTLKVNVLPFFRFYRGSKGKLCSFSCTNATIKKFKDSLAKHAPDRCSIGETKGLEEEELIALAANKDVSFIYTPPRVPDTEQAVGSVPNGGAQ